MFEKIKKFFLYFSVIFLIAGVTSFTAYNWATMSSIEKLAVSSALIIAGLGAYLFLKKDIYKNLALFFSSFTIGTLFAVYGQVYQTGADTWILFRNWAIFLIIPIIATGYYSIVVLFTIVVALGTNFYLELYLSGSIIPFLSSLIFGIVLLLYPFIQKRFNFKFNNIFYNIMTGMFYISFIASGFAAINDRHNGLTAIVLYLLFVAAVYFVGYKQLKKITIKILSITALGCFGVAIIIKMISSIIYTDVTMYIFFSLMVIIGTIVAVIKASNEIESENIKKFTNVVVGFLKVFAFFLLMIFVFSLLSFIGLGEEALIVVAILLVAFSCFAAKMLGLKNDKVEIVAFTAGLLCLGGYLVFQLEMTALLVVFIITVIFNLFWFFMPTRALDLLLLPMNYCLLGFFIEEKAPSINYHYSIITIALIVEAYFYFLYDKKELLSDKLKRILIGNEAVLILLPLSWLSTGIGIFIDDYELMFKYVKYYRIVDIALTTLIGAFIIFKTIKNQKLQIVLCILWLGLNYFAYSEILSLIFVMLIMLIYASKNSKWGILVPTLAACYVIYTYYFTTYRSLLDKSIALSITGGLLLVAYLVLKYGFKGVENNE